MSHRQSAATARRQATDGRDGRAVFRSPLVEGAAWSTWPHVGHMGVASQESMNRVVASCAPTGYRQRRLTKTVSAGGTHAPDGRVRVCC
jgi:hypothetical protein